MENLEIGLLLMVVGMTTVFAILLIVIYLGKALIVLVNKYIPEEIVVKKQVTSQKVTGQTTSTTSITNQTTAAIVSAVSMVTASQGNVIKIEKI